MLSGEDRKTEGNFERCVLCHRDVTVRVSAGLDARLCYVEGCGQLCLACHAALQRGSETAPLSSNIRHTERPRVHLRLRQAH